MQIQSISAINLFGGISIVESDTLTHGPRSVQQAVQVEKPEAFNRQLKFGGIN